MTQNDLAIVSATGEDAVVVAPRERVDLGARDVARHRKHDLRLQPGAPAARARVVALLGVRDVVDDDAPTARGHDFRHFKF